ncbi:MAG: hypothetical protein U0Q15_00490 [Kineosporiaceae bacterium]
MVVTRPPPGRARHRFHSGKPAQSRETRTPAGTKKISEPTRRAYRITSVDPGSGKAPDPVLVAFQAVIDRLNDLFGAEFSRSQVEGFVDTLGAVLLENEALVEQARVNSRVQFLESPDLSDAVVDAVFANQHSHNAIADYIASGNTNSHRLITEIGGMIHAAAGALPSTG